MTTLPAQAFQFLAGLSTLRLNNNSLVALDAQAFAGLAVLTSLDLSNNSLHTIGASVLAGHVSIQYLCARDSRDLSLIFAETWPATTPVPST